MKDKALTKVKNLRLVVGRWGVAKILPASSHEQPSTTTTPLYTFQTALPDAQNPGFSLSCRRH